MSTDQRIRGRRLQRIRAAHLQSEPLCVLCERRGVVRLAQEIDHIVPLFKGGADDEGNRQSLCLGCHAAKTAADMGSRAVGCDASGLPVDPRHPWNRLPPNGCHPPASGWRRDPATPRPGGDPATRGVGRIFGALPPDTDRGGLRATSRNSVGGS